MMGNLDIWNKVNKPPINALKTIGAGRTKGMTDIKPQWRLQIMTDVFGPCGIGWKYTVDRLWTEPGSEDQVCAFALVTVYTKLEDGWSAPIQGIGGSMLVAKEKAGLYTSDEAYKMAVTDALSVAFKALGVAAEIYLGNFDGSKYKEPEPSNEEIQEKVMNYIKECDSLFSLAGVIKWWKDNGERIKKELGKEHALSVYNVMTAKKKQLEEAHNATA
jgi:hypothetical protein